MLTGIISFIFSVAFLPGIASAATTPRWAFLSIVAFGALFFVKTTKITLTHILFMVLILYATVSLLWSPVTFDAMNAWWKLVIFAGIFWIGAETKKIKPYLIGAALGLWINSIVVVAQVYGWHKLPEVVSPGGLFLNKNCGPEFAVLIFVGLVVSRIWWPILGIIPSISYAMYPNGPPRGALIALCVVTLAWVGSRMPRTVTVVTIMSIALVAGHYIISYDPSANQRMEIWADTIAGLKFFGSGIGSFYAKFPHYATHVDTLIERPDHAHNDLLELFYELGIGAIFAIGVFYTAYVSRLAAECSILLAFFVESCFGFPLAMPATAATLAFATGRLAGARASIRDDLSDWRDILRSWMVGFSRFCNGHKESKGGEQDIPARIQNKKCPVLYVDCLPTERGSHYGGYWRTRKGNRQKSTCG